jgi:hypothetical protein
MKESEFIKLNFKFEISNFCANVKVKITSLRTAVRQLANTLTVREFKKRTVGIVFPNLNLEYNPIITRLRRKVVKATRISPTITIQCA